MDARLQRRIQRYGWELAAERYEALWREPLAAVHEALIGRADLKSGDHVLDVACGTGLVTLPAAARVGPTGHVLGVDLAAGMVEAAQGRAASKARGNVSFQRMDAEALDLPDASFDVVLCALGLMYMPDAERALAEMLRVLRPNGRLVLAVWGERATCGWAELFPIVAVEVHTEVCPLFFRLGVGDTLLRACSDAGFASLDLHRLDAALVHADDDAACDAAFIAGPVALAWSRFNAAARDRVRGRYLTCIARWRVADGYRISGQFVLVSGRRRNG